MFAAFKFDQSWSVYSTWFAVPSQKQTKQMHTYKKAIEKTTCYYFKYSMPQTVMFLWYSLEEEKIKES